MDKRNLMLPVMVACGMPGFSQEKPNIIIVNVDDMGYSDPSCYGGDYVETPNIDRLAAEGIRFTQFYTSCPISSPSRTGLTTGMYPTRWGITTFLQDRAGNAANEQNDFLDPSAPSMARALKAGGYATGHFGKWHMGGGRDVKNAPSITRYGFDEYSSTWESPDPDPKLTSSNWIWAPTDEVKRWNRTAYLVDKTLDFLSRNKGKPCFVNLWPDDVHTPWVYENDEASQRESAESFSIVLKELDNQIGRLMQGLKDLGIDDNTIVIFTSDNGPAPAFDGHRTNSLRGQKGTLYEGGIRMPFIIRWPGVIEPGQVNGQSVLCAVDLFPSLCAIVGADLPSEYRLDGVDMSATLLGKEQAVRESPLFWEFGKTKKDRVSPHIAVREGDWKLLVNADGSSVELYDMKNDFNETVNLATSNPETAGRLKQKAIEWFGEAYRQYADHIIRVSADGDPTCAGDAWENATTLQHAVETASQFPSAQIWMKQGTYDVEASVNIDDVAIYGGFDGTERLLSERDWKANPTVIDGGGTVSPLRNFGLDRTVRTVLDGIIVQNGISGSADNGSGNGGGAILANGAKVRNCIFRNNRTADGKNGAALHCHMGTVTIENSLFVNNSSSGNGGAVQVGGGVTAKIINCTLVNNTSSGPGGAFGTGNDASNINIYNTLAWHNTGGDGSPSSYGQNTNKDGGGKIVSMNSAIESDSRKFADGDDVNHIMLSDNNTPDLQNPSPVTGYAGADMTDVEWGAYSYALSEQSLCVDAGNAALTSGLEYDLDMRRRLSGRQIDIGCYEYDNGEPSVTSPVIRVAVDGDNACDGASWDRATTIERAGELAGMYATAVDVWMKEGTYVLDQTLNVDKLRIYGGFDGTETALEERDWNEHHTVIDGGRKISPLRNSALESEVNTVLDGLIIQNGVNHDNANGNGNGGGAILTNGARVSKCIFRNNRTKNGKNGGALHCHVGKIHVDNSLFINNTSSGNGGAVQTGGGATAELVNCTFSNNKAASYGGALGTGNSTSDVNLYNCIAWNNMGHGTYESYGQNADIDGGGSVKSVNSAVESVSRKFGDGDDSGHVVLNRDVTPAFEACSSVSGCSYDEALWSDITGSSYMLTEGSICMDNGNDSFVEERYDLRGNLRISGECVDMGAYEFFPSTAVDKPEYRKAGVVYKNGRLVFTGTDVGDSFAIYSPDGIELRRGKITSDLFHMKYDGRGLILVNLNGNVSKLYVY